MKDFEPTELGAEIDFYLDKIGFYRNTCARFKLSGEFDALPPETPRVLQGYGEVECYMTQETHEKMLWFWKNAMIWYIDSSIKKKDKKKKDIDKPKKP